MNEIKIVDWIIEKVLITKERGSPTHFELVEQLRNRPDELAADVKESR